MAPAIQALDLVIGYNEANTSPLLKFILAKVDDLKFRATKSGSQRKPEPLTRNGLCQSWPHVRIISRQDYSRGFRKAARRVP
jgi:hypothetical protein